MTPGELIRATRRRAGLSQSALARRAGTAQPVVSAYEHDRRDPRVTTLRKLIQACHEELQLGIVAPSPDIPPAATPEEHARRLADVLSLADAVPVRRHEPLLRAPRLVSRS